jgi:hypothetical protein
MKHKHIEWIPKACAHVWQKATCKLFIDSWRACHWLKAIFFNNKLYSKVNKSTRVKVTIIFVHLRFSVMSFSVLLQQSKHMSLLRTNLPCFEYKLTLFDYCNNTKSNYTKPEVDKNNCYFYPCWFVDYWIRYI